jgi:elongation factor P
MVLDTGDSKLAIVVKSQHVKPGKGGAFNTLELIELMSKKKKMLKLRSDDKVERTIMDKASKCTVLYTTDDLVHVMNSETFEQYEIDVQMVPEKCRPFLMDDIEITVESFEGKPVILTLPKAVKIKVKHAIDQKVGATAKVGAFKEGLLENGITIMIPPFIQTGAEIEVNPEDWEYVGKASS